MTAFTLRAECAAPYETALTRVRAALAEAGFGIITEIDIQATFHAKLGVDVPKEVILGACRPELAYRAISIDPSVATLLPCNVVVREDGPRQTIIEAFDPDIMTTLAPGDDRIAEVAADVRTRLAAALATFEQQED